MGRVAVARAPLTSGHERLHRCGQLPIVDVERGADCIGREQGMAAADARGQALVIIRSYQP